MMEKFRTIDGLAAPMLRDNIDTDAIIPVSHMKVLAGDFGKSLFANMRFLPEGGENPDFVLNQPQYRKAEVLVGARNFGCGSSREHAVWALLGYGIRAVIAESFGDIFYNNSFRQGLLPIPLPADDVAAIGRAVTEANGARNIIVDLVAQKLTSPDGTVYDFTVEPMRRRILLDGLDGVGVTLLRADDIAAFQARDRLARPWIYEAGPTGGTAESNHIV